MKRHVRKIATPAGRLTLVVEAEALVAVHWEGTAAPEETPGPCPVLDTAARQLAEYFAGERTHFDVPLRLQGTAFQVQVWNALARVPHGATRSYADLARAIGRPSAARAVGAANGRNPLPIFIPCHRIVGASGALTGFAGGLEIKQRLLTLEATPRP
jgi:methylated-DNA-[protein]-cysteine S-methyltransferase